MVLFESHFELNQLQNDALNVFKQQEFSFRHHKLEGLIPLEGNKALVF